MHYTTGEKGKGTTSIFHPEFSAAEDHKALVDVQETVRRQQSVIEKLLQKQVLASVASSTPSSLTPAKESLSSLSQQSVSSSSFARPIPGVISEHFSLYRAPHVLLASTLTSSFAIDGISLSSEYVSIIAFVAAKFSWRRLGIGGAGAGPVTAAAAV